ncbi:unnamed protein product [Brassicogethes aeneus]|uniref:Uncharacterized protein n=1 Tax=Brassicogethes aeneus TaxID=1431903 RepID=A0A9P0B297_BRAAE|nr:unnamed protein product [Brassicogethes aeneus]
MQWRQQSIQITDLYEIIKSLQATVETLQKQIASRQETKATENFEDIITEIAERKKRENNLIIFNLPESETTDECKIKEILSNITNEDIMIKITRRLGKENSNSVRPLKIELIKKEDVYTVLKNKHKLKTQELKIQITTDKTPLQRQHFKSLLEKIEQHKQSGETDMYIKYVNGNPVISKGKNNSIDQCESTFVEEGQGDSSDKSLPKHDSEVKLSEEIVDNDKATRHFQKRTVSQVLKEVVIFPEQEESVKRNKNKNPLPAVVTSDKWIEIMTAKDNEKLAKETTIKNKRLQKQLKSSEKKKCNKTQMKNSNQAEEEKENLGHEDVSNEVDVLVNNSNEEIGIGNYVIVRYDKEYYPAKVVNQRENEYYCCAMSKSGANRWKWPDKNDLLWYPADDVLLKIKEPKLINTRGVFSVPKMRDFMNDN